MPSDIILKGDQRTEQKRHQSTPRHAAFCKIAENILIRAKGIVKVKKLHRMLIVICDLWKDPTDRIVRTCGHWFALLISTLPHYGSEDTRDRPWAPFCFLLYGG
ncbi:hypothetical protein T4A_6583 [Trichinella pseudospiralis]|uniref:Uncharacterized protein n=1 Tax=Trichinella pseudospiralis TaxID=6337 RepID=A0A0V0XH42_TRIPS|nr:hypothetical protein T4E_12199 [Trichinella pseudospiralis]KRY73631.1 hypothetical protein T4A_6583 [Trichinella pseudospiralis]KRY89067.1 hypothetical protein T4D_16486 [Trichinella pseudospiralis]